MSPRGPELSGRLGLTRFLPVMLALALALAAGCQRSLEFSVPADRQGLQEFAALYRGFYHANNRGPATLKELAVKGQGHPNAVAMLKSEELVVNWGLPLLPQGKAGTHVLAYEHNTPKVGGNVLLQDGWTIRKMTADEFNAANQ